MICRKPKKKLEYLFQRIQIEFFVNYLYSHLINCILNRTYTLVWERIYFIEVQRIQSQRVGTYIPWKKKPLSVRLLAICLFKQFIQLRLAKSERVFGITFDRQESDPFSKANIFPSKALISLTNLPVTA